MVEKDKLKNIYYIIYLNSNNTIHLHNLDSYIYILFIPINPNLFRKSLTSHIYFSFNFLLSFIVHWD
jgi:hypothetical protein